MKTVTAEFVVEIIDGDTFKTGDYVRLNNVCAPEKGQPGWTVARDRLAQLILNKTATVETVASDVYGRRVANVWVGSTDVNYSMRQYGYTCS